MLRVSLDDHFGMSDVSCECCQTATCEWTSVTLLFKRDGNHMFVHCICGYQNCDHWRVFRRQWSHFVTGVPGWTCDRASCLFSLPRARRQTLHQDCVRSSLFGSPSAGTSIATGSSRLLTSRSISSSTSGRSRASPKVPRQQVPATSEQRPDIAEQKRPTTMCEFNNGTVNVSRPLSNCEAHSKFFALTPEVHGSLTVVFQQLTSCGTCVKSRGPKTCSDPVPTRSSTDSFSRNLVSSSPVTSSQSHPDCA